VDYVRGDPRAVAFFGAWWGSADAYSEQAERVDARFDRSRREAVAAILHRGNPDWEKRLDHWVADGGYVVTTGQQPGFLTGPLFSIYKALTAVALAARLEALMSRPVLPVFWVASEDHDWDESDHTFLVDQANSLVRLAARPEGDPGERPIFRVPLGPGYDPPADLFDALPDNDFRSLCLQLVEGAYGDDATLASGFETVLKRVLGNLAPAVVQAHQPELKEAGLSVLLRELSESRESERTLADAASALEAAGYPVQVPILEAGVNLFLEGASGRERLYRDGSGFVMRHSGTRLTEEEVRARVGEDPSVLSPNVLLRPVVESTVFPVLSYVAGPGELTYFAETPGLFERHGLHIPVIHPRAGITAVEPKVRKVMDKFDLTSDDLAQPEHELATAVARDEMPEDARVALGKIRGALGQGTAELVAAVKAVDPTLKGPITNARNAAFSAFTDAEKKIVQSLKRENEIALEQIRKARVNLWPDGAPQERTLNVLQFTGRYGSQFIDSVYETIRTAVEAGAEAPATAET
jgi:bacillithiol biosynthesis cysteine-adding enzyme BshC